MKIRQKRIAVLIVAITSLLIVGIFSGCDGETGIGGVVESTVSPATRHTESSDELQRETLPETETAPGTETTSETETAPGTETAPETETAPGTEMEPGTETTPETETADVVTDYLESVAYLKADETDGSCVILHMDENQYIIATACHVAKTGTERVLFAGREVVVTQYWKSPDYDLAFLVITDSNQDNTAENEKLSVAKIVSEDYGKLTEQDKIWVCGVVAGEKVSREGVLLSDWVYVETFGYHMLWAEAENIKGGMSGGGVFNEKGSFLGLLLGNNTEGQVVALPLNIIKGEWERSDLAGTIDIFSN